MASPAKGTSFERVSDKVSFPSEEHKVQAYWEEIKAFETSLELSKGRPEFTFYDGPPFATGKPHYGHILAGTIKDVVTRYAHQTGHYVSRRFGWDCHGLPIEYEIDQKLGIKSKDDVMAMGVDKYNDECRGIVQRYTAEWETTVKRMGRWIDFKNDYKTMDTDFMESVWWVFKTLQEKGLVYRGFKVMPYSTKCTTPLSNFEANLNYKDVSDPAVTVSFPLKGEHGKDGSALLAWTTTPWTLPSNLCLTLNAKMDYVKIEHTETGKKYILAKSCLGSVFPTPKKKKKSKEVPKAPYTILEEFKGTHLKEAEYEPLFPYFADRVGKGSFRVINDDYVTDGSGTGVVHCAPAFGEDDYRVCLANGVIQRGEPLVCPVDENGCFTEEVTDFKGIYVKEADKALMKHIKDTGRMVKQDSIVHSYPFCWRSESPLIYKAVPSWYVNVEKVKERLLANNAKTYWVPAFVQEKRFYNWLKDARDWAISRSRYWGTPLPVWVSDDGQETVFIGSVQELKDLSGVQDITDLHKDKIDHITIPSKRGPEFGVLKRVPDVFDCWFESGSMPYAQQHYPFENKEKFEAGFPADFIAEGLDQTRGWFYTLMVLSTCLFDKPAFKNLIVNGLVLASDGKKMSKRLKNYPDPLKVVEENSADALRLYLINSPVVRAEKLKFQEKGVFDVVKKVMLPWFHAYRFLVENLIEVELKTGKKYKADKNIYSSATNVMDKWVLSSLHTLIGFVRKEMAAYRLYTVVPALLGFLDQLTNWYVRMNKSRLKGIKGTTPEDRNAALSTLFEVIFTLCKLMAPFTPFLVDFMYKNLRAALPEDEQQDSVHYLFIPEVRPEAHLESIERGIGRMQTVIDLGRKAREKRNISLKMPVAEVIIRHSNKAALDDVEGLVQYVQGELNCRSVKFEVETGDSVKYNCFLDNKLGKVLGKKMGETKRAVAAMDRDAVNEFLEKGEIEIAGTVLKGDNITVSVEFTGDKKRYESNMRDGYLLLLDTEVDEDLKNEYLAREVTNRVQRVRKAANLVPTDPIRVLMECKDEALLKVVEAKADYIKENVRVALEVIATPADAKVLGTETSDVEGVSITVTIIEA